MELGIEKPNVWLIRSLLPSYPVSPKVDQAVIQVLARIIDQNFFDT
jgi:hypothetical protein